MKQNPASSRPVTFDERPHFKDARLNELAESWNVAQFVSFSPSCRQRYAWIAGLEPNQAIAGPAAALELLLQRSGEGRINLRSFLPDRPQGNEFIYGIDRLDDAEAGLRRLTASGMFVIANETIDIHDGGVSGVVQDGVIEFAPGATPRVVETNEATSLPIALGLAVLGRVYRFEVDLPQRSRWRVEFSLHPIRRGFKQTHTIIWEAEETPYSPLSAMPKWPNSFSEFIGDKVFGLLIAEALGLRIPRATALCRTVSPFIFGQATGSDVKWLRTCPRNPEPGLFPTVRGWTDPFKMMAEDSEQRLAGVIIQDEVASHFSGAMLTSDSVNPIIEGVQGFGDQFMLGRAHPARLPDDLKWMLEQLHRTAVEKCGSVRIEWAFDGRDVWVLQLQPEAVLSNGLVIVPGEVEGEVEFQVEEGLDTLREVIARIQGTNIGIKLIGRVGVTSHIADVLRRHRVVSRMSS